jgi:hypothetical protein
LLATRAPSLDKRYRPCYHARNDAIVLVSVLSLFVGKPAEFRHVVIIVAMATTLAETAKRQRTPRQRLGVFYFFLSSEDCRAACTSLGTLFRAMASLAESTSRPVSAEVRVTVLLPDARRAGDAEAICERLRDAAPYCRIRAHGFDPAKEFANGSAHRARVVAAAMQSDVVLFLAANTDRTNAALIALRERADFTRRLTEPAFARAWFSTNRKRSLYVIGDFPGAFDSLALALALGCGDPAAAQRLRADIPLVAMSTLHERQRSQVERREIANL